MADNESARDASAGVGVTLRAYRLRSGRDLAEAAESLHIRKPFLQAIEEGRYEDLPGPTYAAGFIRAYAEYLELDADEAVRRFKRETLGRKIGGDLHFPAPESERGVPKGAILLICVLLAGLAYGGWYYLSSTGTSVSELVTSLPERLTADSAPQSESSPASASAPSSRPAPAPSAASGEKAAGLATGATPPTETTPAETPSPASSSRAASAPATADASAASPFAAPPPPSEEPPKKTVPAAPERAAAESEATPAQPPAQPPTPPQGNGERIVLSAKADSWIELRGRDQGVVLSQVLKAGETLPIEAGRGLTLMTGNAGGLEIVLDGTPLPPLGRNGRVRRGIVLDPAALERMRGGGD